MDALAKFIPFENPTDIETGYTKGKLITIRYTVQEQRLSSYLFGKLEPYYEIHKDNCYEVNYVTDKVASDQLEHFKKAHPEHKDIIYLGFHDKEKNWLIAVDTEGVNYLIIHRKCYFSRFASIDDSIFESDPAVRDIILKLDRENKIMNPPQK